MISDRIAWPRKTRELHSQLLDSSAWNEFRFRPDDVVITTYGKAGTTWTQQIVAQLIFGGREGLDVASLSPWLDLRIPPKEVKLATLEAQRHRRFIKTHLPVDALAFSPDATYIYVGRDGRDVLWSLYNHLASANDDWYRLFNETPGRIGPPLNRPPASTRQYFLEWLEGDGYPLWSFWDNVASWWAIRHLPNVLFLHFADLKRDLPGQIRRVAAFLEIAFEDERFDAAVRHCSFDYMKAHAERHAPHGGRLYKGGAQAFIHKGTNGRWRDVLSADDCRRYEATAQERLGPICARWLAEGGPLDQDFPCRTGLVGHRRDRSGRPCG
jgi:aryl sulfotransferase